MCVYVCVCLFFLRKFSPASYVYNNASECVWFVESLHTCVDFFVDRAANNNPGILLLLIALM